MCSRSTDLRNNTICKTLIRRSSPAGKREARTLLERLRWVTLGYHYNWDTKVRICFTSSLLLLQQHRRGLFQSKRLPRSVVAPFLFISLLPSCLQTYSPSSHTPFPRDLHLLSAHVTAACGFPGFISEAGILNYYRSDSSLGIHVDESELDHTRPLLSFRWDACFFTVVMRKICLNSLFFRVVFTVLVSQPSFSWAAPADRTPPQPCSCTVGT